MAERVVLHIGSMKSGTSFIQNVLGHNKSHLESAGVLFPGARWRSQVKAVQDLIATSGKGRAPLGETGPWAELAAEVNAWPGTAVISMEFLGPRTAQQIDRIAGSFAGARIEAVITCRDLGRNIPAMWLESVQNGAVIGWADYLDGVRARDKDSVAGRGFWRHQDLPVIARRWSKGLGRTETTLVTVPRRGAPSELLWERFASLIDVDPARCDLDVRANPSIGLATAQLLLRLNQRLVDESGTLPKGYDNLVKHRLAKRGLVSRQAQEPRLGLAADWVDDEGRRQVEALRGLGLHVVGDLDELLPEPQSGAHADEVSADDQLDAALDAMVLMFDHWRTSERQLRRARAAGESPSGAGA